MITKFKFTSVLLTIAFPIVLFLLSPIYTSFFSQHKEISYSLVHSESLTERFKGENEWSNLQINFENSELKSAFLTRILVVNSGDVPIERNDFDGSVNFFFAEDFTMLGAKIKSSLPEDLDVKYSFKNNVLSFDGLLLNSNDSITFEILSKTKPEKVKMNSRISGISKPEALNYDSDDGIYLKYSKHTSLLAYNDGTLLKLNIFALVLVCFFILLSANLSSDQFKKNSPAAFLMFILPSSGAILMLLMSITGELKLNTELSGIACLNISLGISLLIFGLSLLSTLWLKKVQSFITS